MVEVKVSGDELQRVQQRLGLFRSKAPVVLSKAINKAAKQSQKTVVNETAQRYAIKKRDLKKRIQLKKAKVSDLTGRVQITSGKIPLSKFKTSPTTPAGNKRKFYSAAVYKGKVKRLLGKKASRSKAFLVRFDSGHTAMVQRDLTDREKLGKAKYKTDVKGVTSRLKHKLVELYGPSYPEVVGNKDVVDVIRKESRKLLENEIKKGVEKALKGEGRQ